MLKTYELIKMLTPKLGEDEAKELVYFVEESRGDVATKVDIENQSRSFKAELQNFATKSDLERVKVDLIKWFFGFWITLLIAIIIRGWL